MDVFTTFNEINEAIISSKDKTNVNSLGSSKNEIGR